MRKRPLFGRDTRHRNAYAYRDCGYWHIGHDRKNIRASAGPVPSASKIRRKLEAYDAVIRADWRRDVEAEARGAEEAAPARGSDCAASARSRGNPLPLKNVLLCTGMPCIRAIALFW